MSRVVMCDACNSVARNVGDRINVPFVQLTIVSGRMPYDICTECQEKPLRELLALFPGPDRKDPRGEYCDDD